ncbi:MAG: cbb3-type cytochrome oxidase assembly protein CcoS [Flavobacteriales bacterium]|nr:cbb3-type cytochrome oxidase assembly protein CcoS [Flavobacteriales bacterium]
MNVIFLLLTASTLVATVFLVAFIRAVRSGQYDDDRSPAVRMLHDPAPSRNIPTPDTPSEHVRANH